MTTKSKLRQIEKAMKDKALTDHIVAIEDINQPGVFRSRDKDGVEKIWTEEELESLDASGVNILRVVWTHEAEPEENRS